MRFQPDPAFAEAAKKAAEKTYEVLSAMEPVHLNLQLIDEADAVATNSADDDCLDYLFRGEHLNGPYLEDAS